MWALISERTSGLAASIPTAWQTRWPIACDMVSFGPSRPWQRTGKMLVSLTRRKLVAALVSTASSGLPAFAQQSERMRRVGVLLSTSEADQESKIRAASIRSGFAQLGWTEGNNLRIDFRWVGETRLVRVRMPQSLSR
jgi:hypothetical protein